MVHFNGHAGIVTVVALALIVVQVSAATDADKTKMLQQVSEELFRKGGQAAVDEFVAATNKQAVLIKYLGAAAPANGKDGAQAFPWCLLTLGFFCT
ncbi:hypothetical protein BV898_18513 [Hypsibius exemplaris]|uniref:Uncharacterized protein n=1 Tax=Hypsibius exemplaris TaxID=2072580 RepID=A0A9X6RNJ1_HYPEX|nr:hypothetical protein BV898_18513 [Hypsibius exemplaris]